MRSPADRAPVEWLARAVAIGALAWSIVRALAGGGATARTTPARLGAALISWTTGGDDATAAYVAMRDAPSASDRDWLRAVRRGGLPVTWGWQGPPPPATAIVAEPLADPAGMTRVAVAAPRGTSVTLADRLGTIDTAEAAGGGMTFVVPAPVRTIDAAARGDARGGLATARASVTDSLLLRPLLVLGSVGWETKFVVRALEERGWKVDERLALAPGHDQGSQGAPLVIDTAHYAAVLALDSGARGAAASVARYARSGGGVVIAGSAARVLGDIAPARLGAWHNVRPISYFALVSSHPSLARRGPDPVVVSAGRIVQVGYDDTWRLRLDSATGVSSHRDWWAGLVASVAYAPATTRPAPPADPAPLAATIARLGPAGGSMVAGRTVPPWIWFGIACGALLAEWASRRLRGAP